MLYIDYTFNKKNNIHEVKYNCKFCGNVEDIDKSKPKLISRISMKDDESIEKWVKPDIESDVTLPRVNYVECINKDCSKKKTEDNEIILLRYDRIQVKFIYFCVHCKKFWKND
jgi:hypothetical protein